MSRAEIGTIKLQGHPEGFQIESTRGRVFVNVPDAGQIAVVDLDDRRQVAAWTVAGLSANFPMALNSEKTRAGHGVSQAAPPGSAGYGGWCCAGKAFGLRRRR